MSSEKPESEKAAPKMVRASELEAVKAARDKAQSELKKSEAEKSSLKTQLTLAQANSVDGGNVAEEVKALLLSTEKEQTERGESQDERERLLDEKEASINEREKKSRIQELVTEHGVTAEQIENVDDPEKEAMRLRLENKGEGNEENPAENAFEQTGASRQPKKEIAQQTDEEFKVTEEKMKAEYYNQPPSSAK